MTKRTLQHSFSLLNVDHVNLSSNWNYENVMSPYYRIYYIDGGEGEITTIKSCTKLEPDYLYLIPSFTLCNLNCKNTLNQFFVQFFEESLSGISLFANNKTVLKIKADQQDAGLFERLLQINPGRGIKRSFNPKVYEKDIYYKEYQELNNQQDIASYLETQGILMQLLARFLSPNVCPQNEKQIAPLKIVDTISYILTSLNKELFVNDLAFRVNQNIDYFSRQFKQFTGKSPMNYINEKRIERAQYLLATSQMTFSQICTETGYDNVSYFSKTFRKFTGISPKDYKKQLHQVAGHF